MFWPPTVLCPTFLESIHTAYCAIKRTWDFTYTFYWVSGSTLNNVLCYTCALSARACVFSFPSLIGRYTHIVLYSYGMYYHHGNTNPSHCALVRACIRSHDLSFLSLIGCYTHIVLYSYGMYCHHGNTNPSHFDSSLLGVFLVHDLFRMLFWIWVDIDISSKCLLFFSLLKWDYE